MVVKVEVLGADMVKQKLNITKTNLINGVQAEMGKVALYMEGEIKQSVSGNRAEPRSVDTGRFRNSVTGTHEADTATISSNVEYAPALEYGTSRMRARKHFGNSLKRNTQRIIQFLTDKINSII